MFKFKIVAIGLVSVATMALPAVATAATPHNSTLISHGSCKFDLYHSYSSTSGYADTENKGGCSEVYAMIKHNGTQTAWNVHTSKATVTAGGSSFSWTSSHGKARQTGGTISTEWGFN